MTSAKPRLVTSATDAPRRSRRALVAIVVPWQRRPGRRPPSPACTARAGSSRFDNTLTTAPSSPTTSVNVPPLSTPTITRGRLRRRSGDRTMLCFPSCAPPLRFGARSRPRCHHPDVLLAHLVPKGTHLLADSRVVAVPHRDGFVGAASQPRVTTREGGARLDA